VIWFPVKYFSETFLILKRNGRGRIKNAYWFSYKLLVILLRFEWTLNFLDKFWKNIQIQNFMKTHPLEPSCSMQKDEQTGRQTDITKLIVAFQNFANALKNCTKWHKSIVPVDYTQWNSQSLFGYPVGGSNPSNWTASLCVFDLSALGLETYKSKTSHCEKWFVEKKSDSQIALHLNLAGPANK